MKAIGRAEAVAEVARLYGATPCLMCAILAGAPLPRLTVAEGAHAVVVPNRFPIRPGHLLVVLRAHHVRVADVPPAAWAEATALAHTATRLLRSTHQAGRSYVASLGADAEAPTTCAHVHLHVVPVAVDARPAAVFTWSAGVYRASEAYWAAETARLRAAWPSGPEG